jgi:predicted DNA-binding transcriptional regulator AlpA
MESECSRPKLARLIDSEQLSRKLEMRLGEVVSHTEQRGFPRPVAYYRDRMLWDEAEVDSWLERDDQYIQAP